MSTRWVAVLARPPQVGAAPPGVSDAAYAAALLEDVYELAEALAGTQVLLVAAPPSRQQAATAVAWPGADIAAVDDTGAELAALDALTDRGARYGVVLAGDVPDLPGLLVGKLFSALTGADAAACPAAGGGLVGAGSRLPVPGWLRHCGLDLDADDALARLAAAAPAGGLATTPGWHRLRRPVDLTALDPGLEGWEATRALLSGRTPA